MRVFVRQRKETDEVEVDDSRFVCEEPDYPELKIGEGRNECEALGSFLYRNWRKSPICAFLSILEQGIDGQPAQLKTRW